MTDKDRDLDQAWRAASNEEPPRALDDKILAAAHRAVASGPRKVPEATSPQRWWMPLLAAAVIGVVAVGIVQLVPNEPVIDTSPSVGMLAKKEKANEAAPTPAAPAVNAPPPQPQPRPQMQAAQAPLKRESTTTPAPPPAKPATTMDEKLTAVPESAPEPFPKKTDAARDALAENAMQPQQSMERKDERSERQAAAASAPAPAAAPPMSAPGRAMMRAQSDYAAAAGSMSQNVAPEEENRRKARDPDAWIADIRKLRNEGRTEDAARELKAFRETVPEADKKLPPDLRDWKP